MRGGSGKMSASKRRISGTLNGTSRAADGGVPVSRAFFPRLPALPGYESMGEHRQRDVPVPALPVAHLIVVQSGFPFRLQRLAATRATVARGVSAGACAR